MAKIQKYTPERVKRILDAVAIGAIRTLACKYAGIDLDTLNRWEKKYPAFHAQMVEAEGRAGIGWLAKIEKAANDGDWRAAAYKLEKLYPDEYGKSVQEQRHSGPDGQGPVEVKHDHGDALTRALDTLATLTATDHAASGPGPTAGG